MNSDTKWIKELLGICEGNTLAKTMDWLGKVYETDVNHENEPFYFLKPNNPRIERIIVNEENGQLGRIRIEGKEFSLMFPFISGLTDDYKRTFNTYDPIYDEQFMFYPAKKGYPFVAIDSWIPETEQNKSLGNIEFKKVSIYFGKHKVPNHYREGWILERRQTS